MRDGYYDMANGASVDLIRAGKLDDKISIITRIKVARDKRGQGYASALMQKVIDDADEDGTLLILAVESYDDGLSNQELGEWYERLGFVWMHEAVLNLPAFLISKVDVEPGNGLVMVRQPKGS